MANDVHIDTDGTLTVNGKVITSKTANKELYDIVRFFTTKSTKVTAKNVEKFMAWAAGIVAATNGFDGLAIPNNIRAWIIGGAAIILAGIHNSTPL